MRTQASDTDPAIERLQIAGLRRLSPGQRFRIANSLTRSVFALSWRNFRRKHTEREEDAVPLLWVRLLYGADLAARVAAYLSACPAGMAG